jgi:hypothetical protein
MTMSVITRIKVITLRRAHMEGKIFLPWLHLSKKDMGSRDQGTASTRRTTMSKAMTAKAKGMLAMEARWATMELESG